jgi:uncharacterized membrane protein
MTSATPRQRPAPARQEAEAPAHIRWWRLRFRWRLSFVGVVGAVAFLCLSLTPSLLPRTTILQGAISGVTAAAGYGFGVLAAWLVGELSTRPRRRPTPRAWRWLATASAVTVAAFSYWGSGWQREVHQLMGMPPPAGYGIPVILLLAVLVAAGIVGLVRLLRAAARRIGAVLGRWVPLQSARVIAELLVVVLAVGVLNGVVIDGFFAATDRMFSAVNDETEPGVQPPDDPLRSGGPGSLVSWASLGNQGRSFVAGGPTMQQLQRFGQVDVRPPIRVYAGLDSASTSRQRAALAVQELQRTEAFSRKVLCVVTTTGTGWVDNKAVDPLEYMYRGDTAIVGLQYSYLPSWLSFLVDKERAHEAGRDLFNRVYGVWSQLPPQQRPQLLVFGESLGSFGAESAFSGVDDIRNRVNGMLLVGPPNRNSLWREIVAERDAGTTEVLPYYEQGTTVRFANTPADLARPSTAWATPRVAYLQHASDPIVWWAPRLIVSRPDWLDEPPGPDVSADMRWLPLITFWQVTADMAFSTGVPPGHGHNYGASTVAAWADIAPPPGWTADHTAALTEIIARYGE